MKKLLALCLLLFCGYAQAAAPVVTCTPSRATGTAPLAVFLDCTGTTGVTIHTGLFSHSFGDTAPGNWSYGSRQGSKNQASGIVAAHVYETAGTFTITSVVCNSSMECSPKTNTITVTAANTTYSTTNTICFTNGSDFTGCPAGATNTGSTSAWATVLAAVATGKRILLRRGDTFTLTADGIVTADGPWQIGAYGSGAKPIVSISSGSNVEVLRIAPAACTGACNDFTVMDLDIRGGDLAGSVAFTAGTGGTVSQALILNNTISDAVDGMTFAGDATTTIYNEFFIVGNSITGFSGTSYGIFSGMGSQYALMGNYVDGTDQTGNHGIRLRVQSKMVVADNTSQNAFGDQLKFYGYDFATAGVTQFAIVSDNKFVNGDNSVYNVLVMPQNSTSDERLTDVLIERNWFVAGSAEVLALAVQGVGVTIRNNVFDGTLAPDSGAARGIEVVGSGATAPASDAVTLANNSYYNGDATPNAAVNAIRVNAGATTVAVINNLAYAPNSASAVVLTDNSAGGVTPTTNSSDAQMRATNPFAATPTTPATFRIDPASYADAGGTASFPAQNRDFYNCEDKTGDNRIGALVAAANRQCYGVAQ